MVRLVSENPKQLQGKKSKGLVLRSQPLTQSAAASRKCSQKPRWAVWPLFTHVNRVSLQPQWHEWRMNFHSQHNLKDVSDSSVITSVCIGTFCLNLSIYYVPCAAITQPVTFPHLQGPNISSLKLLSFFSIISFTEIKYINTKGSKKLVFADIITVILIRKWAFMVLGYIRSMTKWKLIEIRLHPPTCFCRFLSSKGTTELTMLHESNFIHLQLFWGIKLACTYLWRWWDDIEVRGHHPYTQEEPNHAFMLRRENNLKDSRRLNCI